MIFVNSDDKYSNLLDIFYLIVLDIFSGQSDRHSNNIVIEEEKIVFLLLR